MVQEARFGLQQVLRQNGSPCEKQPIECWDQRLTHPQAVEHVHGTFPVNRPRDTVLARELLALELLDGLAYRQPGRTGHLHLSHDGLSRCKSN
jgi:hypothetical protein